MKRALIIGISGQDGAYLARTLLGRGYEVIGTSRDAQLSTFPNLGRLGIRQEVGLHSMALTDFRSVLQTLMRFEPTEIFNLAGQSSVGLSFEQPVETLESIAIGTLNVVEVLRLLKTPARFYNACSSECFGETAAGGASEQSSFAPRSPYGVAKATAYWTVANYREAYGIWACSGILFNHESPLRPERFVTRKVIEVARRIAAGSPERLTLGNIDIERDWGWAPEYVEAMADMLQLSSPEDFVIATGETHPLRAFVAEAFAQVGLDYRDHVTTDPELFRPSDIHRSQGNPAKAARLLGWTATVRMKDVVRRMLLEHRTAALDARPPA
jgi:GDPmannose 4,6-dehydratase